MRTFSEIIDIVVATAKVPHLLPYVTMTANTILQELHSNYPSDYDLHETQLLPMNYDQPLHCQPHATHVAWKIPCDFRGIRAVKYNGCEYVFNKKPGLIQKSSKHFWYQSGDCIIFSGLPHCIDIAYYVHPKQMIYYDVKLRRIKSDAECSYLLREKCTATDPADPKLLWLPYTTVSPWMNSIHSRQVSWITEQYYAVLADGTLSRVLNSQGDTVRGGRYYQAYMQGKTMISRNRGHNLEAEM